ncbi:MAG: (2Fe-2S)-binding protein [Candidatus Aminicenantales bacterium]|jgi:aerobic-type carbon monoxide dehydrogenase small subunit (CoxS/CutS family)
MEKRSDKKTPGGVSRRDFIKGVGTGALGTAVLPGLFAQDAVQTKKGRVPVFDKKTITLTVNGTPQAVLVRANETLLDLLRDRLELTGTKRTCDRGECGGCTVLLDGSPVYACMLLAIRADGKKVTTIEGLARGEKLHPVQEAFVEHDGYQCGFCTPGFIMTTSAFLVKNPSPTPDEIRMALSGNLCRCGNYARIYKAVAAAAEKMKGA